MDEEMMDFCRETFVAYEIDLDYEFDAPRFFDFCRPESLQEAGHAEHWFQSAASYPPSPFALRLFVREGIALENVNISPKSKGVEHMSLLDGEADIGPDLDDSINDITNRDFHGFVGGIFTNLKSGHMTPTYTQASITSTGPTFYNHLVNNPKAKAKSTKPCLPKSSTLMKPTASHLAKKNPTCTAGGSRSHVPPVNGNERSLNNSCLVESQAAKRQKLEGGHLRKVAGAKQQANFVHKAPKKEGGRISMFARPRLTIPREPDLETAQRTERMKPKIVTTKERETSAATMFKARPLNRKILDNPSLLLSKKKTPRLPEFQEFHLKTSERALQHSTATSERASQQSSAVLSSLHHNKFDKVLRQPATHSILDDRNAKRPNDVDAPKHEGCESVLKFKARPLNKKIFMSKGELGVFRNSKQVTTVPMEFKFHTVKRIHHDPPIELFNKLSISSVIDPNPGSHVKLSHPTHTDAKGSKENRLGFIQQEYPLLQQRTCSVRDKQLSFGGKQILRGSNRNISQIGPHFGMGRNMGIH